jgi:polyhydroxyalkanoate synthase
MEMSDAAKAAAGVAPDFDALAQNMARLVEEGGKAVAAYVEANEQGPIKPAFAEEVEQAVKSVGRVAEYWMADPVRAVHAQADLTGKFIDLWATTLRRFYGEDSPQTTPQAPSDKRFSDKDWNAIPIFTFLRQAYTLVSDWAGDLAARADELDPHTREKAQFYVRQISSALSPTNFLVTNPELIRETFTQSGENLVRGMKMLAEDIRAGRGNLRIRQSDGSRFQLGVNLATTPGKVVFRNDLIELIQYAPTTPSVYKRPLLIVPPWINKFYILDLNAEKSFIRWAVSQGLTVFTISWVNPDERQAQKDFAAYMREGVFAALDVIKEITGEPKVSAVGYCVGGTLLSVTLAYMAAKGDERIESATLFTTQVDFRDPGELRIFVDEEQISAIEERMAERGYLDGSKMANAFNMLRPNDLIWSYWVNNYLKGKEPMAFDLLVWNSDSTRMPQANHSYYLRNCYLENNLTQGRMVLDGVKLDLSKVKVPIYNLAAREDHIAPAKSVFVGAQYFGGPMRYVLAGSGHIAGVVNPAGKPKYQYWTGPAPSGDYEDWVAKATETPGSWWPDWIKWIDAQAPKRVEPREPGSKKHPPIGDAPGDYVRMKA